MAFGVRLGVVSFVALGSVLLSSQSCTSSSTNEGSGGSSASGGSAGSAGTGGVGGTGGTGGSAGTGGASGSGGAAGSAGTGGAAGSDGGDASVDADTDAGADADAGPSLCDTLASTLNLGCTGSNQGDLTITTASPLVFGCYRFKEFKVGNADAGLQLTVNLPGDPSHALPTVILADRIVVDSGAILDANFEGWGSSAGPGQGGDTSVPGSPAGGAGHGGKGGGSSGGIAYGSEFLPITVGSGGGAAAANAGGVGGGAVVLCANQEIIMNGTLRATGQPRVSAGAAGGGAGGSLLLVAPTVSGTGSLIARGGKAQNSTFGCGSTGGSGAGGRIAIRATSNSILLTQLDVTGGASDDNCTAKDGDNGTVHFGALP